MTRSLDRPEAASQPPQLQAVLEQIGGVVWTADPDTGSVTFISPQIEVLLGHTAEYWLRAPSLWEDSLHPGDAGVTLADMEAGIRRGQPFQLDYRMRAQDGRTVWIRDFVTPNVSEGRLVSISGLMLDITWQREAEERAKREEARARSLVDNSSDVFAVVDPEGRYIYVNPAVQAIHGIRPEEVLGRQLFSAIHREDLASCLHDFQRVLASPDLTVTGIYRHVSGNGRWRWLEVTSTNRLRDPNVGGIVCHSRDVTDRKLAEQALEASEGRFRSLVQNASDLITVLDAGGTILYESPSIRAVLGYEPDAMVGHSVLEYLPEESHTEIMEMVAALVAGGLGATVRPTFRFRAASGEWRWLEALSTNLLDDPHVGGLVVNSRDVTEQRLAQQALRASQDRLLSSEKLASLGRLTAGLAHEINTPLAATMNRLHVARELVQEYQRSIGHPEVTPDDHREIAGELWTALDEAGKTTARIGEFIRQMRGHTRDTVSGVAEFDPARLAGDTLAMLAHEARAAQVELHLESVRTALTLRGEPGRFTQVLTNLVINAIHACEERAGVRRVDVRFVSGAEALRMEVQDNGSGIRPEVLPRIFDPLYTTKGVGKGTGLGLSIIHDIVQGHFGGSIEVQTELEVGTTFAVLFRPAARHS
ncbi:PAS domain S-box protein [Deinococcus sonorensis]|uniref:histidine kinase n=2 Tax=Deinococcus sonorensis TaxID=309891 RepID=A0AAU7U4W8_9DEIO